MYPSGREIVLGVSGGISAYKSCDLLRRLQESGFLISVIPTAASLNFVGVATWEALSGRPAITDLWKDVYQVPHVVLAKKADLIVVAPATADIIAKIAGGIGDDLLTNLILASSAPLVIVPAMHAQMWLNSATQANVELLKSRGCLVIEPDVGRLTSGDVGVGRYPESSRIVSSINELLEHRADLKGVKVLISAGGTRESIDPVRFIGNRSSGKQGYALAYAAAIRGAIVTLVAANSNLPEIEGIEIIHVNNSAQMQEVLISHFDSSDIVIMAAAISDVRPLLTSESKISKEDLITIELVRNPDITQALSFRKSKQIMIGFAAQTEKSEDAGLLLAIGKLKSKGLDFIFFNDVSGGAIFGADSTEGVILSATGEQSEFSSASKMTLAHKLLDLAHDKLGFSND